MREVEYKFLVSKQDFETIIDIAESNFESSSEKLQINYYYDDKDLSLYKQNVTVRVRQIEDILKLQTKKHFESNAKYQISEETEKTIEKLPEAILFNDDNCIFLSLKGNLITHRKSFKSDDGISLDFDANYYLGVCDFEIEFEFDECNEGKANELMNVLGINRFTLSKGKSTRFFNQLEGRNVYEQI